MALLGGMRYLLTRVGVVWETCRDASAADRCCCRVSRMRRRNLTRTRLTKTEVMHDGTLRLN